MHVGSDRPSLRFLVLAISITLVLPALAVGQESVGYVAPADVSHLLDYRLPDWSYRVWDVDFGFNGRATERRLVGLPRVSNAFHGNLASNFHQAWEREDLAAGAGATVSGTYSRSHDGDDQSERTTSSLAGRIRVSGDLDRYLGGSGFFVGGAGSLGRYYDEQHSDFRSDVDVVEDDFYRRADQVFASAGAGWGRLRNVVPLLRAERLSARLVALGRAPLTAGQMQQLARVFAREYGYRAVFDRSDRHFWQDVLAPLLEPERPLTPAEIFYLQDVLNEVVGDRREGFRCQGAVTYGANTQSDPYDAGNDRRRGVSAGAAWSHNPTLARQLGLSASVVYDWGDHGTDAERSARFACGADHLWNLADRYRWDLSLDYTQRAVIETDQRERDIRAGTAFHVYLEDRVDLVTSATVTYAWTRAGDDVAFTWDWVYRLGLTYHLDRAIF